MWNLIVTLFPVNCLAARNEVDKFCYCDICSENEGHCASHEKCQVGLACGSCKALFSPNYPNSYPSDSEETWQLTSPIGSIINLQFHSFHVKPIKESWKNRDII